MSAPQLDRIDDLEVLQRLESGSEVIALSLNQLERSAVETFEEAHLEEKLDPQLADVVHGCRQPRVERSCAGGSDAMDVAARAGVTPLGCHRFGEAVFDESIERPVDQRAADRQHTPYRPIAIEFSSDCEAVSSLPGQDPEDRVFRGRWLRLGVRSHTVTIYSLVVTRRTRHLLLCIVVFSVVACGSDQGSQEEVLVSAAASLTDLFTDIEKRYESAHPSVDLIVNFGGTSALREQIIEGAPVDVFASADTANMDVLVDRDLVEGDPQVFAVNRLTIAVSPDNPGGVHSLEDLSDGALLVGLCAEEVPCGRLAREVLANAGVSPAIDSNEPDVRALLTKIELGELDVGLVYATDVLSAQDRVDSIPITEDVNATTQYPIASLSASPNGSSATAFIAWLLSEEAQSIIADHGFGLP